MNVRRDTARQWVFSRKTDEEIAHLILRGYDEGPARIEMEGYVNEARAEFRPLMEKWRHLVKEHRKTDQPRPNLGVVATRMGWESEQPLRDLIHDLGFARWDDVHAAVALERD